MVMSFEQELTLQYYNDNAQKFAENTQQVDFHHIQQEFLSYIPAGGHILDFGCGAGRDSRYFLSRGYPVTALEGAEQLAMLAETYIGQEVVRQSFQDFAEIDAYAGIWACASLLHLPWNDLQLVLEKLALGLHRNGIFYASFKYGDFAGMRNGRYFTDMTEERWQDLVQDMTIWKTIKMWVTADVREGRSAEKWLNILCKKHP